MFKGKVYKDIIGEPIVFCDEFVILGKKNIQYDYSKIDKIKITRNTGWGKNKGVLDFKVAGHPMSLWFEQWQYDEMDEIANYITQKSNEINNKEYRMKCNVCGNIFCYTLKDIKENDRKQMTASLGALGSVAAGFSGNTYAMYENNKISTNASNQIMNYSRCPKCGSKDLKDITDLTEQTTQSSDKKDNIEELKKYKELLDMNIITQEEFDKLKKELLNL
jgi:hypothetical protein